MNSLHKHIETDLPSIPAVYSGIGASLSTMVLTLGVEHYDEATQDTLLKAAAAALDFDTRTRNYSDISSEARRRLLGSTATIFEHFGDDSQAQNCQHLINELSPEV